MELFTLDYSVVLTNLINVGVALAFFACFWLANLSFSLYYNLGVAKEGFSGKKLINGIFKLIALCIGMALLTFAISAFPIFLQYIGIPVPESWVEVFNVSAMLMVILTGAMSYGKEAIETVIAIFSRVDKPVDILEDLLVKPEEIKIDK